MCEKHKDTDGGPDNDQDPALSPDNKKETFLWNKVEFSPLL